MKALFALLLIACATLSCDSFDGGVVVEKWHEPSHSYTYTTTVMVGKVLVPQVHIGHDDEDFCIEVAHGADGEKREVEVYEVDEATYNATQIGQFYYSHKR